MEAQELKKILDEFRKTFTKDLKVNGATMSVETKQEVKLLDRRITEIEKNEIGLQEVLKQLVCGVSDLKTEITSMKEHYVTQTEFKPVKGFIIGMIALILSSVGIAVIGLVVLN